MRMHHLILASLLALPALAGAQDADVSEVVQTTQAAQAEQGAEDERQRMNRQQLAARLNQARQQVGRDAGPSLRNVVPQASIVEACLLECRRQGYEPSVCTKGCRGN